MDARGLTWSVFDGFEAPRRTVTWASVIEFIERGEAYTHHLCAEFPGLLAQWNDRLEYLNGDPSCHVWTDFRPLRTDREEHWSDWLHHFLATSTTGHFAYQLFSHSGFEHRDQCTRSAVSREDTTEHRRADLVIRWFSGEHTQLEVKVGDPHLEKTYDTAAELENKYRSPWTHYLLLLHEDEWRWRAIEDRTKAIIHILTWDDVAIALRRSLWLRSEKLPWLAWAHGFCGAIEQRLLDLSPCGADTNQQPIAALHSRNDISRRVRQIAIMKRGLEDV